MAFTRRNLGKIFSMILGKDLGLHFCRSTEAQTPHQSLPLHYRNTIFSFPSPFHSVCAYVFVCAALMEDALQQGNDLCVCVY